jgi:hypothetical protein
VRLWHDTECMAHRHRIAFADDLSRPRRDHFFVWRRSCRTCRTLESWPVSLTYFCSALSVTVTDAGPSALLPCLFEGWDAGTGHAEAFLHLTTGPAKIAPPPGDGAPIGYGVLRGWVSDDRLVLDSERGGLTVDYATRHATIRLPDTGQDPAFARDTLWRLTALELARTVGRYYLHGAALVGRAGADVVCADGGVGKSTLAAAWLKAGHRAITDDGAMLTAGNPPHVTTLPAAWRLSPPAVGWCGLANGPSKQRYWPSSAQRVTQAPVHRLMFAARATLTALVPITAAEALTRLIRQNPLLLTSRSLAIGHLQALQTLSEAVPCYILQLGPDLLHDPENVLACLTMGTASH